MVKSLADELTDILDWIENAGLGDGERARAALVAFCRGLVCGLRYADKESFVADEELLKIFKPKQGEAEVAPHDLTKRKKERRYGENSCLKDS